jgi:hypothetical protein
VTIHPYYAGYIGRVPEGDLLELLASQILETRELLLAAADRGGFRYAEGKWSLKEVVGHMTDTERVMGYRALRIARGDQTPLAGFDQDSYVAAGEFDRRTVEELTGELEAVRRSNVQLFSGFSPEAWLRHGTANDASVTVLAIACILVGHELHHREILLERYLKS